MLKFAGKAIAISAGITILCFVCFLIGMQHAPQPSKESESDHLQVLCDLSRKEPWRSDVVTSCKYMQEFYAIDYICNDLRGCYTEVKSGQDYNQRN